VQETFIRAWRHLPQLSSGDFPVRPWLFRVARNLLTDAARAARSRPVTVRAQAAEEGHDDTGLDRVLDQQVVANALNRLSPAHRAVLMETFYRGRTLAKVARQLGIQQAPAGHVLYERTGLSARSGPWRGRHVMQVAQPPPRSAEPSRSPIRLSS
jgi:RNA polymerase sigma-70 factor (ECF subfamily)